MKVLKYLPALIILLIFNIRISAATINGYVTDYETGEPLIGANVLVAGTKLGAATNMDGFYIIKGLSPSKYYVWTKYIGYKDILDSIIIKSKDEIITLNFKLRPNVVYLDSVATPEIEAYHKKFQELNKIKPVMLVIIDSLTFSNNFLTAYLSLKNNSEDSFCIFKNYDCFTVINPIIRDSTGKLIRGNSYAIDVIGEKTCPDSKDLILIKPGESINYFTKLSHYDFRGFPIGKYSIKIEYEFKTSKPFSLAFCTSKSAIKTLLTGLRGTYVSSNELSFINK
jgi:CarboxypepD_reg-like domain